VGGKGKEVGDPYAYGKRGLSSLIEKGEEGEDRTFHVL